MTDNTGIVVSEQTVWHCTIDLGRTVPPFLATYSGPVVRLNGPGEGQTVSGVIPVTGWAMDYLGLAGVAFAVDGTPVTVSNLSFGDFQPAACLPPEGVGHSACNPYSGFSGTIDTRQLANGTHKLQMVATGNGGFPTLVERTIQVNNCAGTPSVTVTSPAAGSQVSGTTLVQVGASDTNGVAQVAFYVDGVIRATRTSPPYTFAWDTSSLPPGLHTLQARALSTCGNTAASPTVTVRVQPTLRMFIDGPAAGAVVSGPAVPLFGWATDTASIASLSFQLDGQSLALTAPYLYGGNRSDVCNAIPGDPNCPNVGWSASFDSTAFANGTHTLGVTATDGAGQSATITRSFVIANGTPAPVVMISAPANGALVRGAIPVQVVANGSSLGRAELYADGTLVGSDASPPYSFSWATQGTVADGSHTLQAKVYDSLGQLGTSPPTVTVVDNTLPSLWVAAPAANSPVSGTSVRIAGWATDAQRVATLSFLIDGQAVSLFNTDTAVSRPDVCAAVPTGDANCPNVGWRTFFDSTGFPNGSHTLTVTATDTTGNRTLWILPLTVAN